MTIVIQGRMVDLQLQRAILGERNFIERMKAIHFLGGSFRNEDNVRTLRERQS